MSIIERKLIKIVLRVFIFIILNPLIGYYSFSQTSLSSNVLRPDTVTVLLINFGDENNQYQNIVKFKKIKELQLQEMQNSDIEKLGNMICPSSLIIADSPDLSFEDFFKSNINFSDLSELIFQGNQLIKLPEILTGLKNLKKAEPLQFIKQ